MNTTPSKSEPLTKDEIIAAGIERGLADIKAGRFEEITPKSTGKRLAEFEKRYKLKRNNKN